jgi:hypothetical protein
MKYRHHVDGRHLETRTTRKCMISCRDDRIIGFVILCRKDRSIHCLIGAWMAGSSIWNDFVPIGSLIGMISCLMAEIDHEFGAITCLGGRIDHGFGEPLA